MSKPLFVLSPCGTSLLTNHINQTSDDDARKIIGKNANTKNFADINPEEGQKLKDIIEQVREKILVADESVATRMSAELNGIIKLYGDRVSGDRDYHLLLCTDTWLGEITANLVSEWLKNNNFTVEIRRQTDLQTKDITSFQLALSEIVEWCESTVLGYRNAGYHVIFNLTGGFKSVQGFLQSLANFYADEAVYIFETSQDLLRIPRLPVELNAEDVVRENITIFRRLSMNLPVRDTAALPEILLINMDGDISLSPWGEVVWGQTKSKIYQQQLYPTPSDKIQFTPSFIKSVEKITPERRAMVNDKLDRLAQYLEDNDRNTSQRSLASLDFKAIVKNPCPPSTHELDAWSDADAKRIFGHYEGDVFVLDKLDKGLH